MDSKKIEELVKKYWDCETSLEEEQQLREYFRGNDMPEHMRETASLFRYFDEQKSILVEPQFENRVVKKIKSTKHNNGGRVISIVKNSLRIAAGIAVLLVSIYFVRQEIRTGNPVAVEDTYDDPHQAFEETKRALMMISKGFGSAEQQAKKINVFNEAQEKIQAVPTKETEL